MSVVPIRENVAIGQPGLKSGDGGGTFDGMELRVKTLEDAVSDIKMTLVRIEGKLDTLATKDDLRGIGERTAKLEGSALTFWQFIIVVGGVLAIVMRWPELFRALGVTN